MANLAEIAGNIGKRALLTGEKGLRFPVTIKDAKQAYGSVRYMVEPVGGHGLTWVDAVRLEVVREGN